MDNTDRERNFWEQAFCAAVIAQQAMESPEDTASNSGEYADAALAEWRVRYGAKGGA